MGYINVFGVSVSEMPVAESCRIHDQNTRGQQKLKNRLTQEDEIALMRLYVFWGTVVLGSIFLRAFVFTYSDPTISVHGYFDADNNMHIFEKNLHECGTVTDTEQAIAVVDCRTENGDTVKKTLHRIDLVVKNQNVLLTMRYKDGTVYLNNGREMKCRSNQDRRCYVKFHDATGQDDTTVKEHDVSLLQEHFQNARHGVTTFAYGSGISIVFAVVVSSVTRLYRKL